MSKLLKSFADSAKEFRDLKSLITAALLVALHTVMALFLSINVTQSLRISISFIVNVVIGCLFGPVMGFVCGGIGDIVQYIIKPTGPYFFGFTLNAALAGMIYGGFFYGKTPESFLGNINTGKTGKDEEKKWLTVALYLLPAVVIVLGILTPFLSVTNQTSGEVITEGTAVNAVKYVFLGTESKNAAIIAGLLLLSSVVLILMNLWKIHALPLLICVFCSFTAVLSVYTDRKTTSAQFGFWLILLVLICYIVIQIIVLEKQHEVDLTFMIRCIIAITIDTVFINILLGTYWISMMYGKGFMFYFMTRLIKNLIQLPINIIITYYVLGFIKNIKRHVEQ